MDCNQIVLANWRNVLLAIGIGGSECKAVCFIQLPSNIHHIIVVTGYLVWGLIYSVQAPFYADEALSRGANLSQVMSVIIL